MDSLAKLQDSAAAMYDGGWREGDRDEMIAEYGINAAEADAICALLADYARQQ